MSSQKFTLQRRAFAVVALAAAFAVTSTVAQAATVFFDGDPPAGGSLANNLTLTNVADPMPAGGGDTAGEVTDLAAKYSSVATPDVPVPAAAIGKPFSISVDYLIPSNTELNQGDLLYLQVNLNGTNRGSIGFIDPSAAPKDVWSTFTLTDLNFPGGDPTNGPLIPAGTTDISAFLILADNGFGSGSDFPGGLAYYVDNYRIDLVPEPTSFALFGLGVVGLVARRRR